MRNALYTCIALLVVGVLFAAVRMTVEAMSDHSLVVEDFSVPADFAASGMSSEALAEDLASRVAAIRAIADRSAIDAYSGEVRADQAGALKVQIPETGVSLDELERFLHHWVGHQIVVNGELREAQGGSISVVLHIAGTEPIVVKGSSADLDGVMQTAAERAFAIFEPANDVLYLQRVGRPAEAYDAIQRYTQQASFQALPSRDRAAAYCMLAHADPNTRRALASAQLAIDTDRRVLIGWMQSMWESRNLGHDEAVLDFARKALATRKGDQPASERDAYPALIADGHLVLDQFTGNFAAMQSVVQGMEALRGRSYYADDALVAALLHDEVNARRQLALALAATTPGDINVLEVRWDLSSVAGDWRLALDAAKALVAEEETLKSKAPSPEFVARAELMLQTQYRPLLAYAEAMTGDIPSATALISQTPTDCYLCVRMRGRIAAVAGEAAMADRWFAEAVRQAPDLPTVYYEWGQALLARGDLAGAARELSLAHEKGPHFADALKVWGDVLVRQGQPEQALEKYDEALKYAPNWAALKQARAAAARKSS